MEKSIENQRWVRVTTDNQLFFDESPEKIKSPNTKFWLNGRLRATHKTKFKNIFPLYDYEILDLNLEPTTILENRLSIISISDVVVHNFQYSIKCRWKTSCGDEFIEKFTTAYRESPNLRVVYKKAQDFLRLHSKCATAREIELMRTNQVLQEDNQSLKEQIEVLKTELIALTSQEQNVFKRVKKGMAENNEFGQQSSGNSSDALDADN